MGIWREKERLRPMRSLKSGLLGCIVAGLLGTFAVVGCSASGDTGDFGDLATDTDPTEQESTGTALPPSSGDDDDDDTPTSKADAGKKDAGKDAGKGKDAGPPPPEPGDTCTTVDQTVSRSCGKCGKQQALCQEVNGKLEWSDYGPCSGEVGTCTPGSTQACGNCGTQTCSNSCGWGTCTGQPANSCAPGSVQYTNASCSGGGYKNKTCSATCTWGNFSSACEIPMTPNKMTIQSTVGAVRSQQWTLSAETVEKPSTTCSGTLSGTSVRYVPVEISNPTAKVAEISAYQTKSTTGKDADLVIWVYNGNGLPMTDSERGQCVGKVNDSCISGTPSPCGSTSTYNLAGIDKIAIPAGGKVLVYSGAFGASTDVGDGTFVLNIRTDKLQ